MSEVKFCKDCRFYNGDRICEFNYLEDCELDLVTGKLAIPFGKSFASGRRKTELECGKDARWFLPKKPSLWKRIFK